MTRGIYSPVPAAKRAAILAVLRAAADSGLPCPKNIEIGLDVGLSDVRAGTAIMQLCEDGALGIDKQHRACRRIRVMERTGWGPWTDWSLPSAPRTRLGVAPRRDRGEIAAPIATLTERSAEPGATRLKLATLLDQGYPPRVVARMAGLRPHEMDLLAG